MNKRITLGALSALGMFLLIIDSRTAIMGAQEAMEMCIRTVIPSLFPFVVLSALLTGTIGGISWKILQPLGRVLGIPSGAESLFLTGLLGGYPIGAQTVHQVYKAGQLSKKDAQRMLAFCSNAGPSFLFGMIGVKFQNIWLLLALWVIHILSAVAVAVILPGKNEDTLRIPSGPQVTLPLSLRQAVRTMGNICGWIVLFRILIAFLQRWILWIFPTDAQIAFLGFLELANGCCSLQLVRSAGLRFVLCSGMLAFGGICVMMQTASVTGDLGMKEYTWGKILQTVVSLLLSMVAQKFLFHATEQIPIIWPYVIASCFVIVFAWFASRKSKIGLAFRPFPMYNGSIKG